MSAKKKGNYHNLYEQLKKIIKKFHKSWNILKYAKIIFSHGKNRKKIKIKFSQTVIKVEYIRKKKKKIEEQIGTNRTWKNRKELKSITI